MGISKLTNQFKNQLIHSFDEDISSIDLPEKFTFPFYYEPHPLSILAAEQLQAYMSTHDFNHNFGLDPNKKGTVLGKMFGVLIVTDESDNIGFLCAFSGKLGNTYHHVGFVPPLFDLLDPTGFYKIGEAKVNPLNAEIDLLEKSNLEINAQQELDGVKQLAQESKTKIKAEIKAKKAERKKKREEAKEALSEEDFKVLNEKLNQQSIHFHFKLKEHNLYWAKRIAEAEQQFNEQIKPLKLLKEKRKQMSSDLQQRLFAQYDFINQAKEKKNVKEIFENTILKIPPAGAGECAAPKLLQYAFEHDLKPIAIAEFWWGQAPSSEIKKHQHYYPACRGKCEPILGHMLTGIDMDKNPIIHQDTSLKKIETIFENEYILVINKPEEFLSVPGKSSLDSVYFRLTKQYPQFEGPLITHRLDMSTSGIMIIAKTKQAHKIIQQQFIKRKVKKRYVAVLDGILTESSGSINLPLRVDLNDRPRQLVCHEHGKQAQTKWKKVSSTDNTTRVLFYPITGRTHQLRMHAAHPDGLNMPIVGDDLYGTKKDRLHLHAEWISFENPITKDILEFYQAPPF